jgi:hypothetical protein
LEVFLRSLLPLDDLFMKLGLVLRYTLGNEDTGLDDPLSQASLFGEEPLLKVRHRGRIGPNAPHAHEVQRPCRSDLFLLGG